MRNYRKSNFVTNFKAIVLMFIVAVSAGLWVHSVKAQDASAVEAIPSPSLDGMVSVFCVVPQGLQVGVYPVASIAEAKAFVDWMEGGEREILEEFYVGAVTEFVMQELREGAVTPESAEARRQEITKHLGEVHDQVDAGCRKPYLDQKK